MMQTIALWAIRILGYVVFKELLEIVFDAAAARRPEKIELDERALNEVITIFLWIAICIKWL